MKKIILLTLMSFLVVASAGCGRKNTEAPSENTPLPEATPQVIEEAPATPLPDATTLGQTLANEFLTLMETDPDMDAAAIADTLIQNPAILFSGTTMPIEPGYLAGFGNTEISGFTQGVSFAPMIGTIPFVGYIFKLEEGTDAEAFQNLLKDNADLAWNICTQADELVVEVSGNTVFFLMCPDSLEE